MIFVITPRAEKSIHEKNIGGVFYIEKICEKFYMLKADFCRLALGTFLKRITAAGDINETPNTVISDYNIRTVICQVNVKNCPYQLLSIRP